MSFSSFIARRYFFSKRKTFFSSFLTAVCLVAVATGVFALIFVLSVMEGFERDFRGRVLAFRSPVTIRAKAGEDLSEKVAAWSKLDRRIARLVPFAEGEAIARTKEGGVMGLRLRGLAEKPTEARLGRYYEETEFGEKSLVIGDELAATLNVDPASEETVRLIFPLGDVTPSGDMTPRSRELKPTGVFHSGFFEFDTKYALVPYEEALRLFGTEARTGVEVWLKNPADDESVQKTLREKLSAESVTVETWREQNPKLFAAMKLERIGMLLILSMLLLIAAFNIFGLVSLTALDKVKDMAVLRSLGLTQKAVGRIFLRKALAIGATGAVFGGVLGFSLSWGLQKYPVRLPSSYYIEYLPIFISPWGAVLVVFLVPLLTLAASWYPARQASLASPVEVLRYE